MKRTFFKNKTVSNAPTSLATASFVLLAGSCSPLNTSFDKASALNKNLSGSKPGISLPPIPIHVFIYKTKVVDSKRVSPWSKPSAANDAKVVTLTSRNNSELLDEFINKSQVNLPLEGTLPDEGVGIFELSLTQEEIDQDELTGFDTVLKPNENKTWSLSVSVNTPKDIAEKVLKNLQSITLSVKAEKFEMKTTPAGATSPTPAPAPTPSVIPSPVPAPSEAAPEAVVSATPSPTVSVGLDYDFAY